jgi:hypothetical protein
VTPDEEEASWLDHVAEDEAARAAMDEKYPLHISLGVDPDTCLRCEILPIGTTCRRCGGDDDMFEPHPMCDDEIERTGVDIRQPDGAPR